MKRFLIGLLLFCVTVVAFLIHPVAGFASATLAMALPAGTDPNDLDILKAEAEKLEQKMNKLVDPLIEKLAKLDPASAEYKAAMEAELKPVWEKYEKLQKQADALDLKLQKANVPDDNAPVYEQVMHLVKGMEWVKTWKETKRGATLDLKGIDLMNTKTSTVTRVTDTIPPQFTPLQYVPGLRFHIRDLMPVGQATSSTIWMPYESATTNGIARVAEGALKPQSDFTPAVTKWAVEKIATWIKFSEEILEDMPQFTSYITSRWIELLKQAEDYKLLYGTGSSDIKGVAVSGTAWVDDLADSKVDRIMVLDSATTQVQTAGFTPNYILVHPTTAMHIRQTRDSDGGFIWPPYFGNQAMVINGATIIPHPKVTVGDFIVGDFSMGCQLWDRKAANIKFYDQNEDDAKYNLILAVIEERLALVTYQSTAFCVGHFTSALAQGSA